MASLNSIMVRFGRLHLNSSKFFQNSSLSAVVNKSNICFKAPLLPSVSTVLSNFSLSRSSNYPLSLCPSVVTEVGRNKTINQVRSFSQSPILNMISLRRMHEKGPYRIKRKKENPLGPNTPFARGVVLKTVIRKPKKPNSANRKCVLVRLHTGKELYAYVPGIGHTLQEHNVVLVRVGRLRDTPGVKIKCVRGKYDLGQVIKRKTF